MIIEIDIGTMSDMDISSYSRIQIKKINIIPIYIYILNKKILIFYYNRTEIIPTSTVDLHT